MPGMINIAVVMLFSELNDLTGGKCTHEEYEIINNVYMSCDSMTHEDCAKAWKALFFKRYKENIKKREFNSHSWKFFSSLDNVCGKHALSLAEHMKANKNNLEKNIKNTKSIKL